MHTIKDICSHHGLKERFVRRCISAMDDVFSPHITRGDRLAIILDSNGFVLFDRVKQLKEKGVAIPEIAKALRKDLGKIEKVVENRVETKADMLGKVPGGKVGNEPVNLDSEAWKSLNNQVLDLTREKGELATKNAELEGKVRLLEYQANSTRSIEELSAKIEALSKQSKPTQTDISKNESRGEGKKDKQKGEGKKNKKEKKKWRQFGKKKK
jgi:hypothetical protein